MIYVYIYILGLPLSSPSLPLHLPSVAPLAPLAPRDSPIDASPTNPPAPAGEANIRGKSTCPREEVSKVAF